MTSDILKLSMFYVIYVTALPFTDNFICLQMERKLLSSVYLWC